MTTQPNKMLRLRIATGMAVVILCGIRQANAAIVYFDTADPLVLPGETISVSIFTEYMTDYIRMARIGNNVPGTVTNLYLNPNYYPPLNAGSPIPVGQVLIVDVSTGIPPVSPQVSGVLYSFDYTVPKELLPGQVINIFPDPSSYNNVYVSNLGPVTPDGLSLTVIPEPATVLLFGFGLLLLKHEITSKRNDSSRLVLVGVT